MNEILKKRIEEAAGKRSFKYLSQDRIEELELGCHYEAGFIDGAEYALSHQWISVKEALPECSVMVFVKDKYGNYDTAYLSKKGYWIANDGREIIVSFWMPIPKFERIKKNSECNGKQYQEIPGCDEFSTDDINTNRLGYLMYE